NVRGSSLAHNPVRHRWDLTTVVERCRVSDASDRVLNDRAVITTLDYQQVPVVAGPGLVERVEHHSLTHDASVRVRSGVLVASRLMLATLIGGGVVRVEVCSFGLRGPHNECGCHQE